MIVDYKKFRSLVAELESIVYSKEYCWEQKHHMVFEDVLAKQICEAGNIIVPQIQSTFEMEVTTFYKSCTDKIKYLEEVYYAE